MKTNSIHRKPISFLGDSLDVIRSFPQEIKQDIGYDLDLAQQGLSSVNFAPMKGIGSGVSEIRHRDHHGFYRVILVCKLADKIYVLHAFKKQTNKTSPKDLAVSKQRYQHIKG